MRDGDRQKERRQTDRQTDRQRQKERERVILYFISSIQTRVDKGVKKHCLLLCRGFFGTEERNWLGPRRSEGEALEVCVFHVHPGPLSRLNCAEDSVGSPPFWVFVSASI